MDGPNSGWSKLSSYVGLLAKFNASDFNNKFVLPLSIERFSSLNFNSKLPDRRIQLCPLQSELYGNVRVYKCSKNLRANFNNLTPEG